MKIATRWGAMTCLALGVAGYALVVYSVFPLGAALHPDMRAEFVRHPAALYIHIFGSVLALALGPFQFLDAFRARHLRLHRWMGRLYLGVGVLVGGVAGLYVSQFAHGGPPGQLGFGALALAWLYTGARAFDAVRRGDIAEHRRWMLRNYALAFAAVTLRLYLPAAVVADVDFTVAYGVIAWACWVPNLLFAQWLIQRLPAPQRADA